MVNRRGKILIAGAAALAVFAQVTPGNRASLHIFTHDPADLRPARMQAALDLGVVAFSILVTWSKRLAP